MPKDLNGTTGKVPRGGGWWGGRPALGENPPELQRLTGTTQGEGDAPPLKSFRNRHSFVDQLFKKNNALIRRSHLGTFPGQGDF